MRPVEDSPYQLLVEGRDDLHTITALLKSDGYDWDDASTPRPYVRDCGGLQGLLENLPVVAKSCTRLGIVVDADNDCASRWDALRSAVTGFGASLPASSESGGVVVPPPAPPSRVGVWVMPDNRCPGRLEDFIATLVPPGDPCWPHARTSTQQAMQLGAPPAPTDRPKGEVHAWLAWQATPGLPFGTALTAKVLGCGSPEAAAFIARFRRLFVD